MLFSEAHHRKIVSTGTADTVGRVDSFVVDVTTPRVVALRCGKTSGGDVLRWEDVQAFGADAVTVTGGERFGAADEQVERLDAKSATLLKKRVLSTAGAVLGTVRDVAFDPATGALTALVVDGDEVAAGRLVGVGSYAVVVRSEEPPTADPAPGQSAG